MSDDDLFREPRRARRIRDRDRMRARAVSLGKRSYAAPDNAPRADRWTDLDGRERVGTPDWEAVFERRRAYGWARADYLASCSCHMCGNPRRFWNARTLQEVRAAASARSALVAEGIGTSSRLPRLGF